MSILWGYSYFHQHGMLSVFWFSQRGLGAEWRDLFCVPLTTCKLEHLFMSFVVISVSFSVNCLFINLANFSFVLFLFFLWMCRSFCTLRIINPCYMCWQLFPTIQLSLFHFVHFVYFSSCRPFQLLCNCTHNFPLLNIFSGLVRLPHSKPPPLLYIFALRFYKYIFSLARRKFRF